MFKFLKQLEFALAATLLGLIVFLVFIAAIMRFFGHPLIWSVDLAQLMFIWVCFFGATKAMREKSHIGIDFLVRRLSRRHRFGLECLISAVILVFLALLAAEGYKLTLLNRQRLFGDSGLSYAWVTAAVPVGCAMICAALIGNLVKAWQRRNDGHTLVYSRSETEAPATMDL
ncbi:C4-dicarboxylate ABC transporter permease [Paramesorhizobium deserti]|uniref:TRAP transporter small permease protein n=1 Tax=Paramesorhizobium deserti TaxID=1494590 RepID=A0A135HV27_9HYPH|nr:TRAP transporter small permease [Paramesorhizobium deserti]KXF77032.1 C4-dicarboxylate ABC transporter permease [Paramesorhizobium deserti]